jgi:hypothetical protein
MIKQIILTTLLWSFFLMGLNAQEIVINEVMSSNRSILADEDGDYEDWIELYNLSDDPVNLSGYGLSDKTNEPFRWVFPDLTISAGSYLLVWASGKDRRDPSGPLHTNFSISSDGEPIVFTDPSGTLLNESAPVTLEPNISYGRKPDGSINWYYFNEPTREIAISGMVTWGLSIHRFSAIRAGILPSPLICRYPTQNPEQP